jgi:hypothetical protein
MRTIAFFRALDDADHAVHDKLKSTFAPSEVKADPERTRRHIVVLAKQVPCK